MTHGTVYVVGNFKGGVGKTKSVTMLAYESATHFNRKTLVIDLDPQGNATSVLAKTGDITEIDKNVTDGFRQGSLANQITPVIPNLDMISANTAFRNLPKMLVEKFPGDDLAQVTYLQKLIAPLKNRYKAIYLDVPPTISDYSDNAMLASDYCIIVLQTQELSLDGAQTYIAYMQYLADSFDSDLNVLGIIPCMLKPGGRVDDKILQQAREMYGGNVLNTVVKYQERLKVYDVEGIHLNVSANGSRDTWDLRAHKVFIDTLTELDAHQKAFEESAREGA
jgi:cellulose biosynthesis protein BcsQ